MLSLESEGLNILNDCLRKCDLRGVSPSGQEHVGGHDVTCGPDTVTPEDRLAVGKQDP